LDTSTTIKASSIATAVIVGDNIIEEAAIASYIIEAEASAVVRSSATRVVKPTAKVAITAITVIDIVAEEPTMGIKAIVDTFTVRAIDSTTK